MKRFDIFVLGSVLLIYLLVQLPSFFQKNHVYQNLEPYPDGLLYTTSSLNFVKGEGLNLVNGEVVVKSWVPLTYSVILIPIYTLIPKIQAFVFTNILLGIGSLFFLYLTIRKISKNNYVKILSILTFLLNGYVLVLPTLPMTENLSIFAFTLFVYFYTHKDNKKSLIGGLFATTLFLLIKFSNILVGISMIVVLIKRLNLFKVKFSKIYLLFLLSASFLVFILYLNNNLISTIYKSLNSKFFNFDNFLPNLVFYVRSLLIDSKLLWFSAPLSGLLMFLIWITEMKKRSLFWLSILLFAQLPTALLFYVADARYLILFIAALPIFLAKHLSNYKNGPNLLMVGLLCLFTNLFLQRGLIREVIANNVFGKSVAWQVESIYHFNSVLNDNDFIITSIPPLLINEYSDKKIISLPISNHQEFLSKEIIVWDVDIDFNNIKESYNVLINRGEEIYISNSYNSHSNEVQADFDQFKELYNLRLVSSGCQNTCNIYLLESKE